MKSNLASGEKSWYTQLGRVTLDLEQDKFPELENHITETRAILVDNFKALGVQSGNEYQGYHCLLRYLSLITVGLPKKVSSILMFFST